MTSWLFIFGIWITLALFCYLAWVVIGETDGR